MNRYLRRIARFGKGNSAPGRPKPLGEPDPRAKSTGHGKVTADKWNQ